MDVDTIQMNLVKPVDTVKFKAALPNGQIQTRECFEWFGLGQLVGFNLVYFYLSHSNKILMLQMRTKNAQIKTNSCFGHGSKLQANCLSLVEPQLNPSLFSTNSENSIKNIGNISNNIQQIFHPNHNKSKSTENL